METVQRSINRWLAAVADVLNIWVAAGALLLAVLLCACSLGAVWLARPSAGTAVLPTAILDVIYAPTPTPILAGVTPDPAALPGDGAPPSPPPGVIAVGAFVQVTGTGGDGLRFRSQPGLGGDILLLASEAEIFRVDDGPREVDGYTWWYLVGPFDETRHGWAVTNYLSVVQNP